MRDDILKTVEELKQKNELNDGVQMIDHVDISHGDNGTPVESPTVEEVSLVELRNLVAKFQSMTVSIPIQHRILRQLVFGSIYSREVSITAAESGTFQWIIDGAPESDSERDNNHISSATEDDSKTSSWVTTEDDGDEESSQAEGSNRAEEAIVREVFNSSSQFYSSEGEYEGSVYAEDSDREQSKYISEENHNVDECNPQEGAHGGADSDIETNVYPQNSGDNESSIASDHHRGTRPDMSHHSTSKTYHQDPETSVDEYRETDSPKRDASGAPEISLGGFDWFQRLEDEERLQTRQLFLSWLRSGTHICHISGKAGSGKSTLMKLLWHHPKTRSLLEHWASPRKLVFSHFYFWKSANDKFQMSLDGLYRSILFETLTQCPELIEQVFREQWRIFEKSPGGDKTVDSTLFLEPDIEKAIDKLVEHKSYPNYRFCFFIDGLDEHEGDVLAHRELAHRLREWTAGDGIKICASSRPYDEFRIAFADPKNLTIHLHKLTRQDIYTFSRQAFERDQNFARVRDFYLDLATRISYMAEGVFLWASLVVRLLLTGMAQKDSRKVLEEKLEDMPEKIADLYQRLLGTLEGVDRRRSNRMLLLALMNPFKFTLNVQIFPWLDDLDDPRFPPATGLLTLSGTKIRDRREDAKSQIEGLTKGLLEVTRYPPRWSLGGLDPGPFFEWGVQFFHRSVGDYLKVPSRKSELLESFSNFNPTEVYGRLCLAELVYGMATAPIGHSTYPHDFISQVILRLGPRYPDNTEFSREVAEGYKRLIRELEGICDDESDMKVLHFDFGDGSSIPGYPGFFCHLGAWSGHSQYVLHEIANNPDILRADAGASILASAIAGGEPDLVSSLLGCGASPHDEILVEFASDSNLDQYTGLPGYTDLPEYIGLPRYRLVRHVLAPVWMVAAMKLGETLMENGKAANIMRCLIERGADDNCFFLMRAAEAPSTKKKSVIRVIYTITVRQLLHELEEQRTLTHPRPDELVRVDEYPFHKKAKRVIGRSTEPPEDSVPFHLGMAETMVFKVMWICWKDVNLSHDCKYRIC